MTQESGTSGRRMYETGIESRRRILDAAEDLIAERGFEKTSFVEIARRSGISRGSIPWHFANKDGLLLAVVDRATERYLALDQLEDDASLEVVFARFADLGQDNGARLLLTVLNQAISSTGPVREQYQAFYASERKKLMVYLEMVGVRPARAKPLAAAILSGLLGAMLQWLVDPDEVDLEATFKSLAAMVQDHLPA